MMTIDINELDLLPETDPIGTIDLSAMGQWPCESAMTCAHAFTRTITDW